MPLPSNLRCGTAGWSYSNWNGLFYPKSRGRGFHQLEYVAEYFDAVEINTSFYHSLKPELTKLWAAKVSHNSRFLFTAKLNRRFTHDRVLDGGEITAFKDGLWPLLKGRKLGALLMQFPWSFRLTEENRDWLIRLRRAFHEFPLVAEMRHDSWMLDEGLGTFIDYRIGFCNIDQPEYTRAMPPTAFLTSAIGYVRLHGRNPQNSLGGYSHASRQVRAIQHDYLYSAEELSQWQSRIDRIRRSAESVFVIANNDIGAKSTVNMLQLQHSFGDDRRIAPPELRECYREPLAGFRLARAHQAALFQAA